MRLRSGIFVTAGVLIVLAPVLLFGSPVNTIKSGNDLSALSWLLAENEGEGSWKIYPLTITIKIGEFVTFASIENCGITTPPDLRLNEQIPFPLDYTQTDKAVSIIFSEVP